MVINQIAGDWKLFIILDGVENVMSTDSMVSSGLTSRYIRGIIPHRSSKVFGGYWSGWWRLGDD